VNVGVGIARLAPYKPYFQFELFGKYYQTTTAQQNFQTQGVVVIDGKNYDYRGYRQQLQSRITRIGVVPLHLRYNFNDLLSAGAGVRVDADFAGSVDTSRTYLLSNFNGQVNFPYDLKRSSSVKLFSNAEFLPFADVQFGKVRLGPQVGTRFYYGGTNKSYLYFYASWRL